jgi:hypothetical protein
MLPCGSECTITKIQENQIGLELNGTHKLLVYCDDVNLLGENINTKGKTQKFYSRLEGKLAGLEANTEKKTTCMVLSRYQNSWKIIL